MNMFLDILQWIFDLIKKILEKLLELFLRVNIFEKLIIAALIPTFYAIAAPVAWFKMLEIFYVNNPFAVYMIGIVTVMYITMFLRRFLFSMIIRIVINAYYLGWIIYYDHAKLFVKNNPYELTPGFAVNIIVPAVYIVLSAFSYLFVEKNRSA
ncbi:MAG: hypothetical protein GY754_25840 [bacterium]|nr:hypothetical protein [bacterium]